MDSVKDNDRETMFAKNVPDFAQINPRTARFPCCIVWSPLPLLSWLVPFIGHVGICREDGVILDFAGPNFVCVDNFAFGSAARYIQINKEQVLLAFYFCVDACYIQINKEQCCTSGSLSAYESQVLHNQTDSERVILTWDDALRKSTQEFQHRSYNLFTCNCHSFVTNTLNRLDYGEWNVVKLAVLIFFKGRWVSKAAFARSVLPFLVVFGLGVLLGGWTFVTGWALFTVVLVGWFVVGSYCFKNLIQL